MADIKCPSCGKTNPEELEICQFCGTLLKQTRTEPLAPILPGQFPEKKATSELERTLPGWLRDVRSAANEPNTSPIPQVKVPQKSPPPAPTPPPPQSSKAPQSPLDLLAGLSQAAEEDDEIPDWLKSLQGETPAPVAPAAPQAEPQETPDWLADLQEEPAEKEQAPQPEDWGFSSEPTTFNFDEGEEPAQSFGDTPDWLAALDMPESAPQQPQPSAEEFPTLPGADSGDTPDWLASLGSIGTAQPENAPGEIVHPESIETPDWLSSLSGFESPSQPQPESAPPAPGGDLPDWLADLQGPGQTPPDTPVVETPAAEIPSGDIPDWMSGLQESAPSAPESVPSSISSDSPLPPLSSDLPDWMSGLQETLPTETETPAAEIPSGDIPDWMSGLQESAPSAPESVSSDSPLPPLSSDLPDWMSGLQEPAPTEITADEPAPTLEIPSGDLPDWLASAMGEQPASPAAPVAETPSRPTSKPFPTGALDEFRILAESEPLPDFLSGLVPETEEKKPEFEPEAQPGELPDWLAGMAAGAAASIEAEPILSAESEQPIETETETFIFPESEAEGLPPASVPAESKTPVPENEGIDSLLLDVPDWLAGFTPSVEAEQPEPAAPEEGDLRPVELPSWVQAMRPVESMLTGTDSVDVGDGEIEQQGPLAGFRSVLPVAADALEIRKPRPYALKLQVGEAQRAQAALLEKLLAAETESKAVAPPEKVSLLRPLRWILFAILTLAVLLPTILGSRVLPAPGLSTDANAPFNKFYDALTNAVPDGALVLVVTDYQPGFAGELEQAAVPVVAHLMRKNAQMVFLSTSPVSVEMGERLLQKGRAFYAKNGRDVPTYRAGEQYLFLGYLPGGAAGVKAFAEQPQRATGVDSLSGDLWQTDVLRDKITDISGFAAVIVITDDPDNGRLWIEQTGTRLGNTPMLMVTSAQAGPMIQPYAASGQLSGLVSGLEGGALYEKRDAQPGDTYPGHVKALYWDGFGVAVIISLLAIFFGAIWSMVERLRARKDEIEQDEA